MVRAARDAVCHAIASLYTWARTPRSVRRDLCASLSVTDSIGSNDSDRPFAFPVEELQYLVIHHVGDVAVVVVV